MAEFVVELRCWVQAIKVSTGLVVEEGCGVLNVVFVIPLKEDNNGVQIRPRFHCKHYADCRE